MDLNKIINELSQNEKKVLIALKKLEGEGTPEKILEKSGLNQLVEVMNASSWLRSKQLVNIDEHIKTVYSLDVEGKRFLDKGLPEKRVINFLNRNNGIATLSEISKELDKSELPIAIGWLKKNGWANIKKEKETLLEITEEGKEALKHENNDEKLLKLLSEKKNVELDKNKIKSLLKRKKVLKEKDVVSSTISLSRLGSSVIDKGFEIKDEISQITSMIIKERKWENNVIRPYDINAFAPALFGGKPHPLVNLISNIRKIFLEMGFQEIQGDFVESCFWNMDVLFIPQDHPARDMQDTLYCKKPSKIEIKDKNLLNSISLVHKNGGNTSSTGWGYDFSEKEGEKSLLRTHTTVNTIRYLYNNPHPPSKVFSIGRVFRKESIDTTHLPEFYQIEGIVQEKDTNFRQLIGILKEFYSRMGFEKIRFRPGYFPYTEPSMEVEVFWNNKWMELGGSGIFRPEVTQPVGVKNPVLAWGLGLERLAMLKFGVKDIRGLYISDLEWLQKKPLI
jgi:phenylalanyl-tRNA synthetase alpha chain